MNARFRVVPIVMLLLGSTVALAQSQSHMAGQVVDPQGNAVAGAIVRLEPKDKKGVTVEVKSKNDGKYLIGLIRPGNYTLVVTAPPDRVLIHLKGKGINGADKSATWDIDQDASAQDRPEIMVGDVDQITADFVVGPPSMTAEGKRNSANQAAHDDFADGVQKVRSGDYAGGLAKLEPLLVKAPDHVETNYLVAFARHHLGREQEALDALAKVTAKEPDFTGSHVLRGHILESLGKNDEAEAEYRRELAVSKDQSARVESWGSLAAMYEKSNRTPKAIETLEAAVAETPDRGLLLSLSDLYAKSGNRDKAAATLERADKEAGGMDDTAMLNLAISSINDKKYDEAERLASKVEGKNAANDANKSMAHSILARCDLNKGKMADGMAHLEKALALDPASPLAAENRDILKALKKN